MPPVSQCDICAARISKTYDKLTSLSLDSAPAKTRAPDLRMAGKPPQSSNSRSKRVSSGPKARRQSANADSWRDVWTSREVEQTVDLSRLSPSEMPRSFHTYCLIRCTVLVSGTTEQD